MTNDVRWMFQFQFKREYDGTKYFQIIKWRLARGESDAGHAANPLTRATNLLWAATRPA
jgi:hypothetical protein